MKIVNISYKYFPQADPAKWIKGFKLFYGIWEQMALDHEIIYIHFIDFEGTLVHNGVKHIFLKWNNTGLLYPLATNRRIKKMQPDVVMIHGLIFPLQTIQLRWSLGVKAKIVIQHHAEQAPKHWLKKRFQQIADRCIDAYFFTGKEQAVGWIDSALIRDSTKVKEIMEVSSIFQLTNKTIARNAIGSPNSNIYIWVGHLNINKNPLLAAIAFLRFIEETKSDSTLYMIFQSNDLLYKLESLLRDNPILADRLHLVGRVPHADLQMWFSAADFIISTSSYEGSGVAVCEGMSCGCIPILSNIPSFRFMAGLQCGLLYETGSEDNLVKALMKSSKINKHTEEQKTLEQYYHHLSFEAISRSIHDVLSNL